MWRLLVAKCSGVVPPICGTTIGKTITCIIRITGFLYTSTPPPQHICYMYSSRFYLAYSIPGSLVASYDMPGIQWIYSIPGPLVASYDMPGIQGIYSIPGPLVPSYDMPGVQWTYSIPGP